MALFEYSLKKMCHVSHVTCHMSHVTYIYFFFFFYKVVKLVGGGSVINGATPSRSYTNYHKTQNLELTNQDLGKSMSTIGLREAFF